MPGAGAHYNPPPFFEALEARHLLAADLTGAFAAAVPPTALEPGKGSVVAVTIANDGDVAARPGLVEVLAFATDDAFDPATATLLGTRRSTSRVAPGERKDLNVQLAVPRTLHAGTYRLAAVVDAADQTVEGDETNNLATGTAVEVRQRDFDLTAQFISVRRMPQHVVAGAKVKSSARVAISNTATSTEKPARRTTFLVGVYARPTGATDEGQDIALHSRLKKVRPNNFKPGASRRVRIKFATPADLPVGTYDLVARVDPANQFSEMDDTNNASVLVDGAFTVDAAFVDVATSIDGNTLPPSIVTGQATSGKVRVRVANIGNVPLPRGQRVDLDVALRPTGAIDASQDIRIGAVTARRVSGLKPGRSSVASIRVSIDPSLPAGDYAIVATATPTAALVEPDVGNNTATGPAVTAAAAFHDLATAIDRTTLPLYAVTGQTTRAKVRLELTNAGNVALPRGQRVDLEVALRPAGAADASQDVLIGSADGRGIGGLKPGRSKLADVRVTVDPGLPAGDYTVVVKAMPVGALTESDLDNNSQFGPSLTAGLATADLLVESGNSRFGPAAAGTAAVFRSVTKLKLLAAHLTVRNVGSVKVAGRVNARFYFAPNGVLHGEAQLLGGRDGVRISLAPGGRRRIGKIYLELPDPPSVTTGQVLAVIEPIGVPDKEPANNVLPLGALTITPLAQFFDEVIGAITLVTIHGGARGAFVTSSGLAGRYELSGERTKTLTLKFDGPDGTQWLKLYSRHDPGLRRYSTIRLHAEPGRPVRRTVRIFNEGTFADHSGNITAYYSVFRAD